MGTKFLYWSPNNNNLSQKVSLRTLILIFLLKISTNLIPIINKVGKFNKRDIIIYNLQLFSYCLSAYSQKFLLLHISYLILVILLLIFANTCSPFFPQYGRMAAFLSFFAEFAVSTFVVPRFVVTLFAQIVDGLRRGGCWWVVGGARVFDERWGRWRWLEGVGKGAGRHLPHTLSFAFSPLLTSIVRCCCCCLLESLHAMRCCPGA